MLKVWPTLHQGPSSHLVPYVPRYSGHLLLSFDYCVSWDPQDIVVGSQRPWCSALACVACGFEGPRQADGQKSGLVYNHVSPLWMSFVGTKRRMQKTKPLEFKIKTEAFITIFLYNTCVACQGCSHFFIHQDRAIASKNFSLVIFYHCFGQRPIPADLYTLHEQGQ